MDRTLLLAGAAVVAVLLVLGVLLAVSLAGRARVRRDLDDSREQLEALRHRVDELSASAATVPAAVPPAEYLITSIAAPHSAALEPPAGVPLSTGEFVSVALAESLVRIASFGYGVRRALSAENRNRIAFEMRREVKRSRRQRRQEVKQARRNLATAVRNPGDRSAEDAA
jgi:uncharacterized membrane protein